MKTMLLGLLVMAISFVCPNAMSAPVQTPNIVFIFADDLGYGDLHCYGHPYSRTPALDQLAKEGTLFRNFHVTGVTCCPSRTGFMTSKFPASYRAYPADHGFGNRVTVTELLKKGGYTTGHFGKWHIGPEPKPGTYGIDVIGADREPGRRNQPDPRGRGAHIYDAAIKFIEANKDKPFYVNVWDHVPHFPVDPPQAYADKFKNLPIKESDFADTMKEKFDLVRKADGDVAEHMRNFLGEVNAMDESIGRLLKRLDELGLREKTIVVFSSDHGAAPVRIAQDAEAVSARKEKKGKKVEGDNAELRLNMMGYSGGLRGGKHNMYEGGVRVPFIVRWPGRVPAGRVDEKSVVSGIDWLPTLCKLTGVSLPTTDFDGEDVSDIWLGTSRERTKPLLWKTSNVRSEMAILDGEWKLLTAGAKRGETELFDLSKDPWEKNNLAAKHPEVVRRLSVKLDAWNASLPKDYLKAQDRGD